MGGRAVKNGWTERLKEADDPTYREGLQVGRIRLFRLVDQRTTRQHHEADDFAADQNDGEQ